MISSLNEMLGRSLHIHYNNRSQYTAAAYKHSPAGHSVPLLYGIRQSIAGCGDDGAEHRAQSGLTAVEARQPMLRQCAVLLQLESAKSAMTVCLEEQATYRFGCSSGPKILESFAANTTTAVGRLVWLLRKNDVKR
jgi:hypothetical protein